MNILKKEIFKAFKVKTYQFNFCFTSDVNG